MYPPEMRTAAREQAKAEMIKGVIWITAGGLITGFTYAMADTGGSYFVFWGAMAYGAYRLIRAAYFWLNPDALLKRA